MTCLEKICRANRWRLRGISKLATTDANGWNGIFIVPISGTVWYVQLSDQEGWRHLCAHSTDLKPSPEVLHFLTQAFFADDAPVVQFLAPSCLADRHIIHLWESIEAPMPVPVNGPEQTTGAD